MTEDGVKIVEKAQWPKLQFLLLVDNLLTVESYSNLFAANKN
jgi:hypothetical protein